MVQTFVQRCEQLIKEAVELWLCQRKRKNTTPGFVLVNKKVFVSTRTQSEPDPVTDLQVNKMSFHFVAVTIHFKILSLSLKYYVYY